MPLIEEESPSKDTRTKQRETREKESLSNHKSSGDRVPGGKWNFYGRSKTGKTRLACTFPKPLLLIGIEDGTKSVSTGRKLKLTIPDGDAGLKVYQLLVGDKPLGVDFCRITKYIHLELLLKSLLLKDLYKTVVLDHATGYYDLVYTDHLGLKQIPLQKGFGETTESIYGAINTRFMQDVDPLFLLADMLGVEVVIIAHEKDFTKDKRSSVVRDKIGSALTPGTSEWLDGRCDYIGQMLIRPEMKVVTESLEGEETVISSPTGQLEYVFRCISDGVHKAGFRVPEGVRLPEYVPNPSYTLFQQIITGKYKAK